tara:strand:+ start:341 stop:700 length:360 start_codon:yes stop_codon:yes gene_type:complete
MPAIIVKNYEHFNKALPNWNTPHGVHVKNKDHYDRLMKESGSITYEEAKQRADSKKMKEYALSSEGKSILAAARMTKDSKGNVKLGDKTVAAMIKIGAIGKKVPDYMKLPAAYTRGGFQ